ncbi:MAG: hypothetical protein HKM98_04855, partial [Gammaproteobacteria bacterium]|nr:hypothetical protein [Gammaproteobacteria bacterium]
MKNSATHKTIGYRLVSGFLLLWALAYAGLVVFSFLVAGPEHWQAQVDSGRISAEYVVYIEQIPVWAILLTFIVAISRLLGALSLVYRPQWSLALFSLSLLGTVIVMYRGF